MFYLHVIYLQVKFWSDILFWWDSKLRIEICLEIFLHLTHFITKRRNNQAISIVPKEENIKTWRHAIYWVLNIPCTVIIHLLSVISIHTIRKNQWTKSNVLKIFKTVRSHKVLSSELDTHYMWALRFSQTEQGLQLRNNE